jgi:secernin
MGSDMMVALGRATVEGQTLFGQNSSRALEERSSLRLTPGRQYTYGERLTTQYLELPQARQTWTVLGSQPRGFWGYDHGVNEHLVAVGCLPLRPTRLCATPGLLGTDLVRLALERGRTARQAVDVLTIAIERHGQGSFPDGSSRVPHDNAFLVADGREAYAVEAAGTFWVYQAIREVRAISNVRIIRQDWDRISTGLATQAIDRGWWPGDGSKLDFAGALAEDLSACGSALRRWGRATLALQEQNGHIDATFLRRLLTDHNEEDIHEADSPEESMSLCQHAADETGPATAASLLCQLNADPARPLVAWCAFGPPCASVYFPIFLDGELPDRYTHDDLDPVGTSLWWRIHRLGEQCRHDSRRRALARDGFTRLQATFEQEAEEFVAEAAQLRARSGPSELRRQAGLFMEHTVEQFEEGLADLLSARSFVAVGS